MQRQTETDIHRERFIISNWLMQLWRLTSPQTCSRQADDPRKSCWCKSSMKPVNLRSRKTWYLSRSSKQEKRSMLQLKDSHAGRITSYSGKVSISIYSDFQMIRWGPFTSGRPIWVAQSMDLNVKLIQNHPEYCLTMYVGIPWPSYVYVCESRSIVSNSLQPHGL